MSEHNRIEILIKKGIIMKICGISIGSKDANICVIMKNDSEIQLIDTGMTKLSLDNDIDQENIKSYFKIFDAFINENEIDFVAIKARQHKGKFAGGAISFKIESLIQLIEKKVKIISAQTIASKTKKITIPKKIFKYQEEAYKTAYSAMEIK